MINSNCKLYNNVVKLSLNNISTTINDNIMRYFMYNCKNINYNWYESINIIYKKIYKYMLSHFKAKELCESRDSCSDLIFCSKEL